MRVLIHLPNIRKLCTPQNAFLLMAGTFESVIRKISNLRNGANIGPIFMVFLGPYMISTSTCGSNDFIGTLRRSPVNLVKCDIKISFIFIKFYKQNIEYCYLLDKVFVFDLDHLNCMCIVVDTCSYFAICVVVGKNILST